MTTPTLPPSILTKNQEKKYGPRAIDSFSPGARIVATVRHDDRCGNGHNTFSITADIRGPGCDAGGCCHDEVAKAFPELAPFIKWHLVSTDGPMHYIGNTVYHAGDVDHNGNTKDQRKQIINGRTKLPCWTLQAVNAPGGQISTTPTGDKFKEAATVPLFILETGADVATPNDLPPVPVLVWVPLTHDSEGKERDLDAARSSAVWPDATDAELTQDKEALTAALLARLPGLMVEFKAAVEFLGFTY